MAKGCGPSCGCAKRRFEGRQVNVVSRDPVCGKKVDRNNGSAQKLEQAEDTLYFCSTKCMTEYISNPGKYAHKKKTGLLGFLGRG